MSWITNFEDWTKTGFSLGDISSAIEEKSPYLVGKEGFLPDWKIAGKPIGEVFSREGYVAGGAWYRAKASDVFGGFAEGFLGKDNESEDGGNDKDGGNDNDGGGGVVNWLKEESGYNDFERYFANKADDTDNAVKDVYAWVMGQKDGVSGTDLSQLLGGVGKVDVHVPQIDLTPFAAGLAAMGAGMGQGLAGMAPDISIPGMPSIGGEDGETNVALIAALAVAGLGAMYLIGRK